MPPLLFSKKLRGASLGFLAGVLLFLVFVFSFFLFFGGASGDNDDDEGRRSAETPLRNGYAFSSRADFNGKMALVFLLLPTTL